MASSSPSPASAIDFLTLLTKLKVRGKSSKHVFFFDDEFSFVSSTTSTKIVKKERGGDSPLQPPTKNQKPQTTKRTGWVRRGIREPESIADHSFRVALFALVASSSSAASAAAKTFDASRAVKVALVHDLAEAIVGDIAPGDGVPKKEKARLEQEAMAEMRRLLESNSNSNSNDDGGDKNTASASSPSPSHSSPSPSSSIGAEVEALFREYEEGFTPEAQLVKDCDKLEMLLQAVEYEQREASPSAAEEGGEKGGQSDTSLDLSEFFESVRGRLKTEVGRSWGAEIERRRPCNRAV